MPVSLRGLSGSFYRKRAFYFPSKLSYVHKTKYSIKSRMDIKDNTDTAEHKVVAPSDQAIDKCVQVLQRGGIIAVPTDTIYGFAVSAINREAIEKLYSLKGREKTKPIAVCVGGPSDVNRWSHCTVSPELLSRLLPGPVTLVFTRRDTLNSSLNPGKVTVGTRVPDSQFIVDLAKRFDGPIGLTSANLSAEKSTLSVEEFKSLWPKLDLVVDGGVIGRGKAETEASRAGSTVVDLSVPWSYNIIRPGCAYDKTIRVLEEFGLQKL